MRYFIQLIATRRIINFPQLLIIKALLSIYPGKLTYCSASIDLKINTVACQLLRLFAAENDGDIILDLRIMKVTRGSMASDSLSLAPLSGAIAPVSGNSWGHPCLVLLEQL